MGDKSWKALERRIAKFMGGERIKRGDDFSRSAADVALPGMPHVMIDTKHYKDFFHHRIFRDVRKKYCKKPADRAILVTKVNRQGDQLYLFCVEAELFLDLFGAAKTLASENPQKLPENLKKLLASGQEPSTLKADEAPRKKRDRKSRSYDLPDRRHGRKVEP